MQIALSLGPNQKEASLVGAYNMNGWAQAVRNCPTMATRYPDWANTLEHTMGWIVLTYRRTDPTRLNPAPRYSYVGGRKLHMRTHTHHNLMAYSPILSTQRHPVYQY